jgi:serine/threonine protein kinase
MEVYCTRPKCSRPVNHFTDLDSNATLKVVQQKFCTTCGMPLILAGRYLTIRLLGQGGFGAAFLARDRYTPGLRQCVVKQFQPSGNLSPAQLKVAQELFEREGEVLDKLGNEHPQIPDLLAFFELDVPTSIPSQTDRFFYLVQEFIDGENLEEELARRGKFSEGEVIEVLTEILKVLQFVHDNHSIHRDIKLSNIMRHRNGRLYLLDFGAVKQVTSGAAASGGGKASTGIYSMGFAPPEQMAGDVVYPATDLYALGVTCITLLTGKQPNELYDSFSNDWNWRGYAAVSDRLEAILNRMLMFSPKQRFQSAKEVLDALKPDPVTPSPSFPPPQPPHPVATANPVPPTNQPVPRQPASATAPAPMRPAPAPPRPTKAAPTKPAFSTLEFLGNAAFTGFEGGLLAIALASAVGTSLIGAGFWVVLLGGLVLAQSQRWIEKVDLLIIAALTLAIVAFFPALRSFSLIGSLSNPLIGLVAVAVFAGLILMAIAIIFRLIYKILSSIL